MSSLRQTSIDAWRKEAHKTITFEESRGALKVIELCNEQGIAVLPIHDSFIVKKQHMQTLETMMVLAYEVLGFVSEARVVGGLENGEILPIFNFKILR